MLTPVSNTIVTSGYAGQAVSVSDRVAGPSDNAARESDANDTVSISQEARSLQKTYNEKENRLEEKYASAADQLEQDFQQEKARLQQEYNQKKQSLGISLVV